MRSLKPVDVALDYAGELLGRVTPRLGTVELTGAGTNLYFEEALDYPVMSLDQSRVNVLEALIGTGDAFQRAFETLTGESPHKKAILLSVMAKSVR